MKKLIIVFLIMGVCLATGCSNPLSDKSGAAGNESTLNINQNTTSDQGAGQESTDQKQAPAQASMHVTIYYQDLNGLIVPVSRKIEKQEGIARAAITGLIDGAGNREQIEYYGIYPTLPEGTEIKGINIKDGTAFIDFNDKLLTYKDQAEEHSIIASIVYTLTEFKTVQNVRILIDGHEKSILKYNTDISGDLNRNNVLINSKNVNLEKDSNKADIYLFDKANDNYSYILPVSFEYSGSVSENLPGKIVELYGENYGNSKLYSQLPQNIKLRNVIIKDDLLVLDFSKELISYGGGTARESALLNQILLSMKQVKGINKIRILVEGKENALPEGTISNALTAPTIINNVMDQK